MTIERCLHGQVAIVWGCWWLTDIRWNLVDGLADNPRMNAKPRTITEASRDRAGPLHPDDASTLILRALWLPVEEIEALRARHRSPLILDCIRDFQSGRRFPLDLLADYPDAE